MRILLQFSSGMICLQTGKPFVSSVLGQVLEGNASDSSSDSDKGAVGNVSV